MPSRDDISRIDAFLSAGGFRRAPSPGGALARSRAQRDARVEPRAPLAQNREKLELIQAPVLAADDLVHAFTTRGGGFSITFGGRDLNLGGSLDSRETIARNRAKLITSLAGSARAAQKFTLVTMKQVHSGHIEFVTGAPARPLTGDGMITAVPGLLLAVQVADCVPVLIADVRQNVIGAFHAGWRGTVKRIVERGVGDMRALFGSQPRHMRAAIGPCIGGCCYAIGPEVEDEFNSQFAYAMELFHNVHDDDPVKKKYPMLFLTARAPGHGDTGPQRHLDLVEANRRQLLDAGLAAKHIWSAGLCTSCASDRLFSHRKEAGFTGRMMGVIGIRPSKAAAAKR